MRTRPIAPPYRVRSSTSSPPAPPPCCVDGSDKLWDSLAADHYLSTSEVRLATQTSPLMSIMLIFLGILRTTHSRVRRRKTAPRPAPFPTKSASPTSSSAPSSPIPNRRTSAQPPWPPGQPGPLRQRPCCFNPPRACGAVQPGVFRGSELWFRLPIIPVIVSPTLTFAPTAGRGEAGDGDCDHRAPEPSCAAALPPGHLHSACLTPQSLARALWDGGCQPP